MAYTEHDSLLKNSETGHYDASSDLSVRGLGPLEISPKTRRNILISVWIAQFLSALNLTLVPTSMESTWYRIRLLHSVLNFIVSVLPSISSDFHKSNEASLVGTSYVLATCTFTPLYGRLCDVMGRRRTNQSAIILAGVGILCCGFSTSMKVLIASRFCSGLGGGGIFVNASIVTSDMYNLRSRGFVQSIGGIFYGLGMGLGGPIGGLITDWLGWRWAFLLQFPFFLLSFTLTTCNLNYIISESRTPAKEILKKIDYGGTATLMGSIASVLCFLNSRYNEGRAWADPNVYLSLIAVCILFSAFLLIEAYVAVEPILPPHLLTEKVPFLVGFSNAFVAVCNVSVTYYFPMWFQTVMLSSASTAGLHLLPNSVCISTGSVFAGWMMRRTGTYKTLNMTFGCLPFLAALLLLHMKESSGPAHLWMSIMPLGFGNAIVLQTMYIALVAHLPESQMAIGTGFAQLLRGLGQVGGLATASAIFQSQLDAQLSKNILTPDAAELIARIRHSVRLIGKLPPDLQRIVRDAYATSIKSVFTLAACASLMAYLSRLPIPDKHLGEHHAPSDETTSASDDDSASTCSIREYGATQGIKANPSPETVVVVHK